MGHLMDKFQKPNALLIFVLILHVIFTPAHAASKIDEAVGGSTPLQDSGYSLTDNGESTNKFDAILKNLQSQRLVQLASLKGQLPDSDIRAAMKLAKAIGFLKSNRHEAAFDLIKDETSVLLEEYLSLYKAKALANLHKYDDALTHLPSIKAFNRKIDLERFWLRMKTLAYLKQSQTIQTELALIQRARPKDQWVRIKGSYYKGLAEFEKGNKTGAISHFTDVLVQNPGTSYDKKIFKLFKVKSVTSSALLTPAMWNLRAEKLIASGFPHEGQQIWEDFYRRDKSYEERVAYGTFRARDYRLAAELYERLLAKGTNQSDRISILSKIAQAYSRYDNFAKAIEVNKKIIAEYPKTSAAVEANFKLGFLYFDSQQYQKAAAYLEKFIRSGTRLQREQARWFRLWSFYLTKDFKSALSEIENLLKEKRGKADQVKLTYWKARILEKLGNKSEARTLYSRVATMDGLDYYGLMSRHRQSHAKLYPKTLVHPDILSMVPSGKNKSADSHPNLRGLNLDTPLKKAILLYDIGLDNFAFDESRSSVHVRSTPSFSIAKAFEEAGNFNQGYVFRSLAMNGQLNGSDQLSAFRLGFPRAYASYVSAFASMWGMDEKLAYSIMRQESAFKPEALSYAFAYGLMQVIPPTGAEIAGKIHFNNFEVEQLNEPIINTLFGTFYLKYLLDEFNGEMIFAMAGYNAGPDAVRRWSAKASSMEMDEFIELIPYDQTNHYVKKVLVNYLVYSKIYP